MEFRASSEDVAHTTHAHPTLSEVVKEACLAVEGRPIHGGLSSRNEIKPWLCWGFLFRRLGTCGSSESKE